jgi:hypothetical protein
MNERVERFARECGAWNQVYGNRNFMIDEHFDIEKFARLIVRECAQVCRDQPNYYALKKDRDNCAVAIEEHFGVDNVGT